MSAPHLTLALGVITACYGCAFDWDGSASQPDAGPDRDAEANSADASGQDADTSGRDTADASADAKVDGENDASTPAAPTAPPKAGLRSWFRGDECSVTSDGNFVECTDLSHSRSTLKSSEPHAASINASSVGRKPAVKLTAGHLYYDAQRTRADRFTLTTVYRATLDNSSILLWNVRENVTEGDATRTQYTRFTISSNSALFTWWHDEAKSGPAHSMSFRVPATPASKPEVGAIITLVASESGFRLYTNGVQVAVTSEKLPSFLLDGSLFHHPGPESSEFAEALIYGRDLNDEELERLHQYLGARYDIALDGLQAWLDASDIFASRLTADGISPESGLGAATKDTIYDRLLGAVYSAPVPPTGPTRFDDSERLLNGLDSSGSSRIRTLKYGGTTHFVPAGAQVSGEPLELCSNPDFLELIVLRIDETTGSFALWESGTLAAPGRSASLRGSAADQTLELVWTDASGTTTSATSAEGVVPLGTPFLLAIYGSRPHGSIQASINGKQELTLQNHACPSGLKGDSPVLHIPRGALAERRLYRGPFSDAQVARLQRELAAKYGIDLE